MNFDLNQMQSLLGQAKRQYDELRQRMAQATVEATAGAGMVWVKMNGEKQLLELKLDPEVVKNDPDMLPDLIRAAVNEAARRVDEMLKAELGSTFGGLGGGLLGNLPGPF
ncbi:MAG TPA: YbaB/EbfC family nucleoid-associated protein [Terriglobales bacterium]|nr:YbaB/EbfC family nucleoid-associated protein [Terriglobales bacterium]